MHPHASSGGVTTIFPVRSESPAIVPLWINFPEWSYSSCKNESALSGNHGLPSNIGLTLAGIPKFIGGPAQREREPSYKRCGNRGDESIVAIENASYFTKRESNYTISGALFCALLCGFTYLVMRGKIRTEKENKQ
jgi:hypothetical protein